MGRALADDSFRQTCVLLSSGVASAGLGYVWTLLASRLLPVVEYADFAAAAAIVYFMNGALAPISQTVAYFTAHSRGAAVVHQFTRGVLLLGSAAIVLVIATARPIARVLHFTSVVMPPVLIATSVVVALLAVRRGFLQGERRFDAYAVNVTAEALARLVLLVVAGLAVSRGAWAVATFGAAAVCAALTLRVPSQHDRTAVPGVIRYFFPTFAAMAIYSAFLNADMLFAKAFLSPPLAAMYGAASFLSRAAGMITLPFYVFALPHLVTARDAVERLRRFRRIVFQYSVLAGLSVVTLALFRHGFVAILVGARYRLAAELIPFLSVSVAVAGLNFILLQLPIAAGRFRFLPFYACGAAIEGAAVLLRHSTPLEIAEAAVASQIVTAAIAVTFALGGGVPPVRRSAEVESPRSA